MPSVYSFTVLPVLPNTLKHLKAIAGNMFWCWNSEFVNLFRHLDSSLWTACGYNPVKLLACVPQQRLEAVAENEAFLHDLQLAYEKLQSYLKAPTWFEKVCSKTRQPLIAYFSAEFGIHECLPLYAGGLGVLAGDHLKSASDLGISLAGVGLCYQKGYFRQYLNVDGWQQEVYIENDFYNMPMEQVQDSQGHPLTISVEFPGRSVHAQIWYVSVGRVKLYLLNTNIPANSQADRMITASLYGGDREMRIQQEMMLGIGGLRALMAMNLKPDVCHMNEGHAAFMALERIRHLRSETNISFDEAVEATKAGNIFTVHTPVKAGNDEFSTEMMNKYFSDYLPGLGIDNNKFMSLGRVSAATESGLFKMPVLALRLSAYHNGVSRLHGQVSRTMWSCLWPQLPVDEVPITSITNGAHVKSWLSEEMNRLYQRYLGPAWADTVDDVATWENIEKVPDDELWQIHQVCKRNLITFCRNRLKAQMQRRGSFHTELKHAEEVLEPEVLTIGFARRFATYKRGALLMKDCNRLVKLLTNAERPLQIVFAGKAHPKDTEGKEIIRQIINFAGKYDVRRRILFLEDYDINVARLMVQGVDVWLSTPRKPMEASGTSGMKAAINGVLNMSTLDGWWCEGYNGESGWAIGAGETYDDAAYQDLVESQLIYNILENEVIPLFYARTVDNIPKGWVRKMKNCIKFIVPRFNMQRVVREYAEKFYIPAEARQRLLNADSGDGTSRARALSAWKSNMKAAWPGFAVKNVQIQISNGHDSVELDTKAQQVRVGSLLNVKVLVGLSGARPDDVSVELYHGPLDVWGNITDGCAVRMNSAQLPDTGSNGDCLFEGSVRCKTSGRQGMAVRVLPSHSDMVHPYEPGMIIWQDKL
ncbi:MAG TPA: alpha-glucan family phosphorylase [Sedimentisphaerales bacterium]|nr:alpha-glucan family phosphorylase [Sedimentisphaerales bacterium]